MLICDLVLHDISKMSNKLNQNRKKTKKRIHSTWGTCKCHSQTVRKYGSNAKKSYMLYMYLYRYIMRLRDIMISEKEN